MDNSSDTHTSDFWRLVDERSALQAELKSLTGADGQPRGMSILGWESRTRKRAHAVMDELNQTQQGFEKAQRDFAVASRERVLSLKKGMAASDEFDELKALRHKIAEANGDLTSLRATARAMVAQSRNFRKRDESSLIALLRRATKS